MASFSIREEPTRWSSPSTSPPRLNDFRSNSFRDSLYQAVEGRDRQGVALDLRNVDFLSSSGLAILVGLKRRVDALHGKLVIFGVQPVVHELLKITRLTQYFRFAGDEPEALTKLRPLPTA